MTSTSFYFICIHSSRLDRSTLAIYTVLISLISIEVYRLLIEKPNKELIIESQLTLDHNKYSTIYSEPLHKNEFRQIAETVTEKLIEIKYKEEIAEYEAEIEAVETGDTSKIKYDSIPQKKDPPEKQEKKDVWV